MKKEYKNLFKEYEKEVEIQEFGGTSAANLTKKKSKIASYSPAKRHIVRGLGIMACSVAVIVVAVGAIALASMTQSKNNSVTKRDFSFGRVQQMKMNTVTALNEINYPDPKMKTENAINKEYVNAMNSFAFDVFKNGLGTDNFGFSSMSMFMQLDILSEFANDTFKTVFDEILGENIATRRIDFANTYTNNYYSDGKNGMYMYNGFFMNKSGYLDDEQISMLTDRYVEAFSFDVNNRNDLEKVVEWANNHSNTEKITVNDILDKDSIIDFYLMSTMYFSNTWNHKFDASKSYKSNFYCSNGKIEKQKYMRHSIYTAYKEFENCHSFYDDYTNGYSVQYILPKEGNSIENLNYVLTNEVINDFMGDYEPKFIDLRVPVFTSKNKLDLTGYLMNSKAGRIFGLNEEDVFKDQLHITESRNVYITKTLQTNEVKFDEEGTVVKTLVVTAGGSKSAEPGVSIYLNRPFVYVIRDRAHNPIFIGLYNTPTK